MAAKKKKSPSRSEIPQPQKIELKPSLSVTENTMVIYANHAETFFSQHDFSISFARLPASVSPSKLEEAKEAGVIQFDAEVQIVIPLTMMPGLLRALNTVKDAYESVAGATIKDPGEPR